MHIKLFEEFVFEKEIQSTDIKVGKDSAVDRTTPNYDWTSVQEWVWAASKSGKDWKISFTLPKVASFELDRSGVRINPIGNIQKDKFDRGTATNFDYSVIGSGWYKRKGDIPSTLGILVRNCARAVFADKLNFDFKHEYYESLKKFGYEMGEHTFDPSSNRDDLKNWVEYAPSLISARGSFTSYLPELKKALKEVSNMLPDELTIKAEIQ